MCIGVVLALVALVWLPAPAARRLNAAVRDMAAPFGAALASGIARFQREVRQDRNALLDEYAQARVALALARQEARQAQALAEENRALRELLALRRRSGQSLLAAAVVARDVNGWWQKARLDKGAADGVASNMPVLGATVAAQGLIGRTVEVSAHTCDVLFLVDPSCKVSARIARLEAFGIVRGQGVTLSGDMVCRMDFILRDAAIQPGDEVVTSGLGGVYPRGLLVGYVANAYVDRSGLYQCAELVPAVDLRALDWVLIVTGESGT